VAGLMALRWYARARDGHAKLAPPPLREVLAAVPHAPVRHLFGISYLLALNKSMNVLIPRLGMLLIPALPWLLEWLDLPAMSQEEAYRDNGHYGIANHLSWGLGLAMSGVVQTLLPTLGLKLGQTDVPFERMGGLLRRVSLSAGGIMVGATLLSVPAMYVLIRVAYGEQYGDSFKYYCWLTSGNLFIGFAVIIEPFLIYSGRLKVAVMANMVMAVIYVVGIFVGGRLWGPIGVAAAAGLGRAFTVFHLVYIWAYFRQARRRLHGPAHPGHAP
jgi:O-antigen/teichoic acid export membrane protein